MPSPTELHAPPARERTFVAGDADALLTQASPDAYAEFAPSAPLRPWVRRIGVCREHLPDDAAVVERVLPDGAVHLHLSFGDRPLELGVGDGYPAEARGAVLAPAMVRMAGRIDGLTLSLRPGGMAALLGVPAGELAGQCVPLDTLWGARAAEALERLAALPGAGRVALAERLLLDAVRGREAPSAAAVAAMRVIAESGGRLRVREIAAMVGVGERRLEQLFHAHVGMTPKGACRLARFHAALARLRREPRERWSSIAHACGYADQPHLVHEFRALAGLAPGELAAALGFGFSQDAAPAAG